MASNNPLLRIQSIKLSKNNIPWNSEQLLSTLLLQLFKEFRFIMMYL